MHIFSKYHKCIKALLPQNIHLSVPELTQTASTSLYLITETLFPHSQSSVRITPYVLITKVTTCFILHVTSYCNIVHIEWVNMCVLVHGNSEQWKKKGRCFLCALVSRVGVSVCECVWSTWVCIICYCSPILHYCEHL